MSLRPRTSHTLVLAGGVAVALIGAGVGQRFGGALIAPLQAGADRAIIEAGGRGVAAHFVDAQGWYTRHPRLTGGERLGDAARSRVAMAAASVPGVGGVHWLSQRGMVTASDPDPMLACQTQVEAMLKSRTIRFAENSAAIDPASQGLLNEVAAALRPCAGSIIAVTGHTDAKGNEVANLFLSRERALAVRNALAARGIDMAGLRARGVGSERPMPGLDPEDPANRRIVFSVIAPVSPAPTVVDSPGAGQEASSLASRSMPLWLEISVLAVLTYAGGITIAGGLLRRRLAARPNVSP